MKDSGIEWLGQVPAHWETRKLSSITNKITNGYVGPTRDILVNDGVPYLQSLHIKNNIIRFGGDYFVTPEWSAGHAKSILQEGDVLIVQTGDVGQCAVVTADFIGANCHALIVVSPRKHLLSGEWLAWVFNSVYGRDTLLSIQTGALHPHLNCGDVKDVFVPMPPLDEQKEIITSIKLQAAALDEMSTEATQAITLLRERRAALISAAVTGKIDVRAFVSTTQEAA
jgi:type I restriction enzyme S subunit